MNREINHLSDEFLSVLELHDWPGNIRELQNFLERAVILSEGPRLLPPHRELPAMVKSRPPAAAQTLAEAERNHIAEALRQSGGVIGGRDGAAARLGVARTTLLYRMQKLGVASPNRQSS